MVKSAMMGLRTTVVLSNFAPSPKPHSGPRNRFLESELYENSASDHEKTTTGHLGLAREGDWHLRYALGLRIG